MTSAEALQHLIAMRQHLEAGGHGEHKTAVAVQMMLAAYDRQRKALKLAMGKLENASKFTEVGSLSEIRAVLEETK